MPAKDAAQKRLGGQTAAEVVIQLISNFYFIALDFASKYTTRSWPFGNNNELAMDKFYILECYGNFALSTEVPELIRELL